MEAAMIGSFLISLAALVIAVVGCAWMQPNDVGPPNGTTTRIRRGRRPAMTGQDGMAVDIASSSRD
jgi:hypothetical protein